MDVPFTIPKMKFNFLSTNKKGQLKRPALLAVLMAFLGGALLHLVHHQEGAHEAVEIAPVLHWLRDSSLALPLILIAVLLGMGFTRWLVKWRGWQMRPWRTALMEMVSIALLAGAIITAANPLHSLVFQASHAHEVSLTAHLLRDGLLSLSIYLLVAGIFVLIWPSVPRLKAEPGSRPRVLVFGTMLTVALVLNFLLLSPFGAMLGLPQLMPLTTAVAGGACVRTITADIVALDQPFYYNRLGAIQPNGMMYALARDVVTNANNQPVSELTNAQRAGLAGQVSLRSDKRPRPIVLRLNEGDCLSINFTNLLHPVEFIYNLPGDFPTGQILGLGVPINPQIQDQPLTRQASIHIDGLYLFGDIGSDGSSVGQNPLGSLVDPGGSQTYKYHAEHEATHLMYSMGATIGADGGGGARTYGLFGAVNVQVAGAEWYRSQLTRQEMDWATPAEGFTDYDGNGQWDAGLSEPLTDWNGNLGQDNGISEPLTDWSGNGVQDNGIAEPLTDWNGDGVQNNGIAEPFVDLNGNGILDGNETFTDWNGNLVWDASVDEPFTDWNGNLVWDASVDEPFTDWNGNLVWDASVNEPFSDWNGNGVWDSVLDEPLIDTNGDGIWNAHRTTPGGQPLLNYDAVYPATAGPGKAGLPIINMLANTSEGPKLVHTDLNAIITGPGRGDFQGAYVNNAASGDRNAPFREFTVIFHDDAFGVQAFPAFFNDPVLGHTLAGVTDSFPVNYGSGGIGSEIVANRLGVGPMWDCAECKYEEFFLTSWTVGDPAMIVDIPANSDLNGDGQPDAGAKATKALYPDDPSNVHHSYLNDRVKFRNLHAGPKEHHIFHLHAHQWLFNPDDPQSNYLDGQAIGPGSGYTYEIAYGGSGNRNKTAGDSIFHCHFYPHFAQGMWEMWRVHDTFQQGTLMDIDPADGLPIPAAGSRALADGEIAAGTPIPGLVPIPTNAMAVMPDPAATIVASDLNGDGVFDSSQFDANGDDIADILQVSDATAAPAINPGYPWYIPGMMGHRPPTPAYDMDPDMDGSSAGNDGGLPRHIVTSGPDEDNLAHAGAPVESYVSRLDFNKILHEASALQIPEAGTPAEQVAMAFHSQQFWPTYSAEPDAGTGLPLSTNFETNGLPPAAGAPYADPCRAFNGAGPWTADYPNGTVRTIKAANIEMPVVLNKVGWHFQQQRFEALWEDVIDTLTNAKAPEPMIMRLNSTDCAEFWHTNLVPNVYQLDDYQVRTPTDIIGQHIHLVKFDVMSADGSANGFNYEDGTLSPDEVRERIEAFNNGGGFTKIDGTVSTNLAPEPHPVFGGLGPNGQNWLGARTTIQRWYADPLLERSWDGGVGTVFTHDHYGPSTHQQVGLYSTLLVEPEGSVWRHNETGDLLGTRGDGGPTTWQAIIEPGAGHPNQFEAHREFYFEFADFQHAYEANGGALITQPNENLLGPSVPIPSYADFAGAINPSFRLPPVNPADIYVHPNWCPGTTFDPVTGAPLVVVERPCPEAISADDPGTYALNFRNEPIGLRIFNGEMGALAGQAPGLAGDLAFAYQSRTDRAIPELNTQPAGPYPPLTADVQPGDPWTPMLRVYMGDRVRVRVQVGAHEEEHNFTIPGLRWLKEPNSPNSGYRNSEFFGIDEYFNLDVPIIPDVSNGSPNRVDYIYTVGAELEGMWNGVWGIMRSYGSLRADLYELPNNQVGRNGYEIANEAEFNGICPADAPLKTFDVTAVRAVDVLDTQGQGLVYNDRLTTLRAIEPGGFQGSGPLIDPTALIYVLNEDLTYDATGAPNGLQPGAPVEPLILRVNAGDCVKVNLTNALPADLSGTEMPGWNSMPPIIQKDENILVPGEGGILTFNANDIVPSSYVGLTPQLLSFDPRSDGGFSTGLTTGRLVAPGDTTPYTWYAGNVTAENVGIARNRTQFALNAVPVEFGAAGLMPADRIKGTENGLVGAIIVEPRCATWVEDPGTRAQATVTKGVFDEFTGTCDFDAPTVTAFRDFVTIMQNDVNLRYGGIVNQVLAIDPVTGVQTLGPDIDCGLAANMALMECAVPNIAAEGPLGPTEESQDSGQKAINYKSDPPWFRLGVVPDAFQLLHRDTGLIDLIPVVFSNSLDIGVGPVGEPQTQIFNASPTGPQEGRFRVLMPGGHARGVTYTLHGHEWNSRPYINDSTEIGDNPTSEYYGTQEGINPTGHWDFVVDLGGPFDVKGDYLWRDQAAFGSFQGLWGLLRYNFTAPVVEDGTATVVKYQSVDINLTNLIFDLDGDATTVTITGPTFGDLFENGFGTYTYTSTSWPACGDPFACTDSFTYTVTDGEGNVSNTGAVIITVTNSAPTANNDTIIIKSPALDGSVDVLLNDFDAEGDLDPLRSPFVELVGQPVDRNGVPVGTLADAIVDSLDGRTVTYTPPSTFSGVVLITYQVTDESGAVSNQAVIRAAVNVDDITITSARFQPQNGNWSISGTCTDPFLADGVTPTTITIFSGPSVEGTPLIIGTATCVAGDPVGTWSFSGASAAPEPDPNVFNFVSAQSAKGGFYEGFPVTFAGQNNAPVAADDPYTIDEDTVLNGNVLTNDVDADFDPLTAVLVTNVTNGTLALNADGTFTYTPDANYNGTDTFTYQADDGKDLSNVATVTITINAINDAPSAGGDSYAMASGDVLNVPAPGVLANDSDVEGGVLGFTLDTTPVSGPAPGNSLTLNADGSFTYTPDPGDPLAVPEVPPFFGTDSFQYRICEDLGGPDELCGTATVTISVGVNDAPVAADDAYTAVQNTALTVELAAGVLVNDTDADGDGLTAALLTGTANGTLTLNADGSFTYTPTFNFVGTDSFTYVANDGTVDSNVATVTITVEDVVTVTSASYRTRQGRWNIQGTVSNTASSVDVYLCTATNNCADLIGTANVDAITGDWSFTGASDVVAVDGAGDSVIAVSSGGGISEPPFPVNVRR